MSEERLDRIEALLERVGQLAESNTKNIEALNNKLDKRIESNAKSIEALTHSMAEEREQRRQDREILRRDRAHVFEWMARLAAAQADFYESQADYHHHLDRLENRLIDILDRLAPKNED